MQHNSIESYSYLKIIEQEDRAFETIIKER